MCYIYVEDMTNKNTKKLDNAITHVSIYPITILHNS